MYKFNFLQKINLDKLEVAKKNKFITMVFMMSVSVQLILLGLLFLKSMSVNTSYQEARDVKNIYDKQTSDFRKKGFFKYKKINNTYNVLVARRQLSYLFKSFETSLDTTIIIDKFDYDGDFIHLDLVSRNNGSKSKLMTEINQLRSKIGERLIVGNYITKSSTIELVRGPDLKNKEKNEDGTQYWFFSYSIKLDKAKIKEKKKSKKKSKKLNI